MASLEPRFQTIEPILAVSDVRSTLTYYRDILGFSYVWEWDDPPTHGGAQVDNIHIQFSLSKKFAPTTAVWLKVFELAELYQRHRANRVEIVDDLADRPWGVTEYVVRDLNGYHLRFTGAISRGDVKEPLPENFRVESGLPTANELSDLKSAVGWNGDVKILAAAVFGVTARIEDQAVGCAFVTTDGAGFFYVRDVIVHPDWQRRGVGKRLMAPVAEFLQTSVPPNSLAGLFTGTNLNDFYGEFGFRPGQYALHGMTMTCGRPTDGA